MAETIHPEGSPVLHTIETRWFGQGAIPADILAWFEALPGQAEAQPVRRDFYLQPIDDDGLSVKLREGGLEVKQRRESFGLMRCNRSVAGLFERWVKWRFPLDQSSSPVQATYGGDSSWIAVDKERQLKQYQFGEAGTIRYTPSSTGVVAQRSERAPLTYHLELARVWAGGSQWWSVGYEAGSEGESPLDRLLTAASKQFEEGAPGQLTGPNSYGYPHWLVTRLE